MIEPVLHATRLGFAWPESPVRVEIAELAVAPGERWLLEGPSGAGKSTLLQLLGGVLVPDSGEVHLLGRYLLGIPSTAGSVIDPLTRQIVLRNNWGAMTAYKHQWTQAVRSSAMFGYAKAKPLDWMPADTFENSTYGAVNLMWQALPYLTVGVEYSYGQRTLKDGSSLDNNRLGIGFQFY